MRVIGKTDGNVKIVVENRKRNPMLKCFKNVGCRADFDRSSGFDVQADLLAVFAGENAIGRAGVNFCGKFRRTFANADFYIKRNSGQTCVVFNQMSKIKSVYQSQPPQ